MTTKIPDDQLDEQFRSIRIPALPSMSRDEERAQQKLQQVLSVCGSVSKNTMLARSRSTSEAIEIEPTHSPRTKKSVEYGSMWELFC
jgi:hypothetical protein